MGDLGEKLAKIARKGSLDAAKKYFRMSVHGNLWNQGIESYISSKIGEKIYSMTGKMIELEYTYAKVLEELVPDGFVERENFKLTMGSKFDIVVFRRTNKKAIAVIEVKKRFSEFKISKDRERVLDAMINCNCEGSGVRFGIIVAIEAIRNNQKKTPETKMVEALAILKDDQEDYRATIEYDDQYMSLGKTSKKKTDIIGARAYSIVMRKN